MLSGNSSGVNVGLWLEFGKDHTMQEENIVLLALNVASLLFN